MNQRKTEHIQSGESQDSSDGVSIIVPVFNEEGSIKSFLAELDEFLQNFEQPVEIILVDDGSTDETPALLAEQSHLMIRHEVNLGYGAAIKTGIDHSQYDIIVIIDADGTYPVDEIGAILPYISHYDMVLGARTGDEVYIPFFRRPAKWIIRHFAAWLVRRPIADLNSGLRVFRRESIEKLKRLLPDGFSLTTTMTVAFLASGKRVYYHPIHYRKRTGKSKFRPFSDTWNMILIILRTVVLIRPLNVFLPLSFILAGMALVVLLFSKLVLGKFMDATFIVLMMTSIQMFVLGLIADLIVRINLWTH